MRWGSKPNSKHHSFSFPSTAMLLILLRSLIVSCLICSTCLESLRSTVPGFFYRLLQDCWYWDTINGKSLVGNLAFDDGDATDPLRSFKSCIQNIFNTMLANTGSLSSQSLDCIDKNIHFNIAKHELLNALPLSKSLSLFLQLFDFGVLKNVSTS